MFRYFLFVSLALLVAPFTAQAAVVVDNWPVIQATFFANKTVVAASNEISIQAPVQAEDAALVPVSFEVKLSDATISHVYLFTDANPIVHTGTFHLPPQSQHFKVATRVRLESNTIFRVIVETSAGQLLMAAVPIKTPGGGCGGAANADESALRASAGKMKLQKHETALAFNIKHPMRTGFERTVYGYYAKAWYINRIDFKQDATTILSIDVGPGISADPYFRFETLQADEVEVEAKDNEGKLYQQRFNI